MNSRKRVLLVLDHKEPNRMPIDFGELITSLQNEAHRRLLEHLETPCYIAHCLCGG